MTRPLLAVLLAALPACASGPIREVKAVESKAADPALREKILGLIPRLHGRYTLDRIEARSQLVLIGTPAAPFLIDALRHESPGIRGQAALALGEIGDPRAAPPLIALVNDPELEPRKYACRSLGRLGELGHLEDPALREQAGEAVYVLLKDRSAEVRSYAAESLRRMHYAAAIPRLISLLKDPDPEVRFYAQDSLSGITGFQTFRNDHWRWQRWWIEESERAKDGELPYPDVFHVVSGVHRTPEDLEIERRYNEERRRLGREATDEEKYYHYPDPPKSRREFKGQIYRSVDEAMRAPETR